MQSINALVDAVGWLWLVAVILNFLATMSESWGSLRRKDQEEARQGFAAFVVWAAALLAPGLLLLQGFVVTANQAPDQIIPAIGAVLISIFGATLLGWLLGAMFRSAAGFFHFIAGALSFVAVVLALMAAWPNVGIIVAFVRGILGV